MDPRIKELAHNLINYSVWKGNECSYSEGLSQHFKEEVSDS